MTGLIARLLVSVPLAGEDFSRSGLRTSSEMPTRN